MSLQINRNLDVKQNLLNLIRTRNPKFNDITKDQFTLIGVQGGVNTSWVEMTTPQGKIQFSVTDSFSIQGIPSKGLSGQVTMRYSRSVLNLLQITEIAGMKAQKSTFIPVSTILTAGGESGNVIVSLANNDTVTRKRAQKCISAYFGLREDAVNIQIYYGGNSAEFHMTGLSEPDGNVAAAVITPNSDPAINGHYLYRGTVTLYFQNG